MNMVQRVTFLEKNRYLFRNYPKKSCDILLFPGCSFPSQFPDTMEMLARLCRDHGVGVAYDCCGKPIDELGRVRDAGRIAREITRHSERLGVREIVCVCPNCIEYLGGTLSLPVTGIYTLLSRWGYVSQSAPPAGVMFSPCPDRKEGRTRAEIGALLPLDGLRRIEQVPCCGLRGDIVAQGPAAADKLCTMVKERACGETIYTYCASCAGQLQRHGCGRVQHLLSVLMGVEEEPDAIHALRNRIKTKFIK